MQAPPQSILAVPHTAAAIAIVSPGHVALRDFRAKSWLAGEPGCRNICLGGTCCCHDTCEAANYAGNVSLQPGFPDLAALQTPSAVCAAAAAAAAAPAANSPFPSLCPKCGELPVLLTKGTRVLV
jgi:hypothetical protein